MAGLLSFNGGYAGTAGIRTIFIKCKMR